ncbi:MAG TPA: lipid-A-disaccharide synthase [Candidatus Binatia bacterium]|jgi:lipid-A-disaccharide synthase
MAKPMNQPIPEPRRIVLVAGEASGDLHGAHLVHALRQRTPDVEVWALAGEALKKENVRVIFDVADIAGMGLTELAGNFKNLWRAYASVKKVLREQKPNLLVLIDFPDFNMRIAAIAKRLGIPVLYYITPQVWAWRRRRVKKMARAIDRAAVVFPFEAAFYENAGLKAEFVGHPLLDTARATRPREETLARLGLDPAVRTIALLPGSRRREVDYHLPVMLEAGALLGRESALQFVLVRASTLDSGELARRLAAAPVAVSLSDGDAYNVIEAADLVWTASGTATLETALMLRPMVIVYRMSPTTFALARRLVRVEHIGMANIIAGEKVVPELIQDDLTPARIAAESRKILGDRDVRERMVAKLGQVRARLGEPGAAGRVADIALGMMR